MKQKSTQQRKEHEKPLVIRLFSRYSSTDIYSGKFFSITDLCTLVVCIQYVKFKRYERLWLLSHDIGITERAKFYHKYDLFCFFSVKCKNAFSSYNIIFPSDGIQAFHTAAVINR